MGHPPSDRLQSSQMTPQSESAPAGIDLPHRRDDESGGEQSMLPLYAALGFLAVGMLVYSQTNSFFDDEGFHFLAAHLIDAGKRPYLDFFFNQTPLNAYWNAGWMFIFGGKWRLIHVVATLVTVSSIVLLTQYVVGLFPDRRWRLAAGYAALALFGLHPFVWMAGTIAQAYPMCMLLAVAAFRAGIGGVARSRIWMSALAGLCAGAAASASLLTAPVAPVLLIWMWLNNRAGNRWIKAAAFLGGAVVACAPLLVLFARAPHVVMFDIIKFHAFYRRTGWNDFVSHDISIITGWVNSSPTLLLVLLALAGLFLTNESAFAPSRRAEFRLCLWLAAGLGLESAFATPTFPQYFCFMIPFLAVLGVVGFYDVISRLYSRDRVQDPVLLLLGVALLCLTNRFYDERGQETWRQLEQVTNKMEQVTPAGASVYAPEHIYFLANWPVPSGMEDADSHKLDLPPAENARLHLVPQEEVDRRIQSGEFATAVVCDDDGYVSDLQSWSTYSQSDTIGDCTVFWRLTTKSPAPTPKS